MAQNNASWKSPEEKLRRHETPRDCSCEKDYGYISELWHSSLADANYRPTIIHSAIVGEVAPVRLNKTVSLRIIYELRFAKSDYVRIQRS